MILEEINEELGPWPPSPPLWPPPGSLPDCPEHPGFDDFNDFWLNGVLPALESALENYPVLSEGSLSLLCTTFP